MRSLGWKIPWKRKWQPTSVFLPGEAQGERGLVGYSLRGCKRVRHDLATKQQHRLMGMKEVALISWLRFYGTHLSVKHSPSNSGKSLGNLTCAKEQALSHTTQLFIPPALLALSMDIIGPGREVLSSVLIALHSFRGVPKLSCLYLHVQQFYHKTLFIYSFHLWRTETWSKGKLETNLSHRHHTILRTAPLLW